MKFKKQDLQNMACGESELLEKVEESIRDTGRWSITYSAVFKDTTTGKHYKTYYSSVATEYQDEMPFEYGAEEIECPEVVQVEKTVKVWKKIEGEE
jgi:hypothetical protein